MVVLWWSVLVVVVVMTAASPSSRRKSVGSSHSREFISVFFFIWHNIIKSIVSACRTYRYKSSIVTTDLCLVSVIGHNLYLSPVGEYRLSTIRFSIISYRISGKRFSVIVPSFRVTTYLESYLSMLLYNIVPCTVKIPEEDCFFHLLYIICQTMIILIIILWW